MATLMPKLRQPTATVTSEQELREQLVQEIENKTKKCSNPTFVCSYPRIENHEYCIKHILRDPRNNYKQCCFIYGNGRKCPNALPKYDLKKDPDLTSYCFEHSRQIQLQKTHRDIGKLRRTDTNEALLQGLLHHLHIEEITTEKPTVTYDQEEVIDVVSPYVAPFVSYEQIHDLEGVVRSLRKRRRILDYASDSSNDEDNRRCLNNTSRGYDQNETECDSVEEDEPLKHAAIYTREEAILISEEKLTKLQGLYIDQISRLHHLLKEKRRRYVHDVRKERETHCSIHNQLKKTTRERQLYEKLKALNSYHRRHGVEAILYKKFKEKRSRSLHVYSQKGPGFIKCVFTEGGVKCGVRVLPSSKYCRKHILEDKKQTLFRACGVEKNGVKCREPIPDIFPGATCVLHIAMPEQKDFSQKKNNSDTEDEDGSTRKAFKAKKEICDKGNNDNAEILFNADSAERAANITISH